MKRHANLAFFVPHLGCPHQCVFCDQKSISGQQKAPTAEEVTKTCSRFLPGNGSETEIAFFGGSFTAIDRAPGSGISVRKRRKGIGHKDIHQA